MSEQTHVPSTPEGSSQPEAPKVAEAPAGPESPAAKARPAAPLPDTESVCAALTTGTGASSAGNTAGQAGEGRGKCKCKGRGRGKGKGATRGKVGGNGKRPRRGRVAIEFAECSLGEVLNASPTGLRARHKGSRRNLPEVDDRFNMQVQTPDGPALVRARVAWIKRVGLRTHDIGVHFVPADERSAARLRQLATMAGRSIVITDGNGGTTLRAG